MGGLVGGEVLTDGVLHRLTAGSSTGPREQLLAWFVTDGRAFPWREHNDPWRVLLTEVLLRKTGAGVVARHVTALADQYRDPVVLAQAERDVLAEQLAPLGLRYQRADQLLALGKVLVERHGGAVPHTAGELCALPAVGRYAATATLVFGFGRSAGVVDTNVVRVLARVYRIRSAMLEARKDRRFWELAEWFVGDGPPRDTNWALLDLGALVCVARVPRCEVCALVRWCATGSRALRGEESRPRDLGG